jgi:signal transduction histidine kinase
MVRKLQNKFIMTAMLAVTILLTVLIAAINILNYAVTANGRRQLLQMLCRDRGRIMQEEDEDGGRKENRFGNFFDQRAMQRRSSYALIYLDEDGNVSRTDLSHIFELEEEEASALALQALAMEEEEGKIGSYLYRREDLSRMPEQRPFEDREKPGDFPEDETSGTLLVLLDISDMAGSAMSFLLISVLIALICWAAMILPVRLLSHYMIRPVAENIQRQKEFVTNAGHEIKTPLAIIQANTDALELFQGESKWTRNIRSQTVRLSGLMQNLLTLSKMDETGLQLVLEPFDLSQALGEAWKPFADPAENRRLQVEFDPGESAAVTGSRDSLIQLFSILFDNALKYTPEGGRITIRLEKDSRYVTVRQSNTCTPDQMPGDPSRLFERFYREDRSRKKGGYGIGLSAAAAIARANHADLSARAAGENIIEFTFRI